MTRPLQSRPRGVWGSLGSPNTVRIIFVAMIVYFLIIGGLVLGYSRVQNCLAKYSDQSASALRIRVQTGSDDRALNKRIEAVNTSDRNSIIATQAATRQLLLSTLNTGRAPDKAIKNYLTVNDRALSQFQKNETERESIAAERSRIDAVRATAPDVAPPSETC